MGYWIASAVFLTICWMVWSIQRTRATQVLIQPWKERFHATPVWSWSGTALRFQRGSITLLGTFQHRLGRISLRIESKEWLDFTWDWEVATDNLLRQSGPVHPLELPVKGTHRMLASHPEQIYALLGERAGWDLCEWITISQCRGCRMAVQQGKCVFEGVFEGQAGRSAERWVECVLAFVDQMQVHAYQEIDYIPPSNRNALANSSSQRLESSSQQAPVVRTCAICGQAVAKSWLQCQRCGSIHHRDCWEFNGRCSTFGCACEDAREVTQS